MKACLALAIFWPSFPVEASRGMVSTQIQEGKMEGEIKAADYEWQFQWHFRRGKLVVKPSLGRALIYEPLGRFLERSDYQLEPGGDYEFLLRAKL